MKTREEIIQKMVSLLGVAKELGEINESLSEEFTNKQLNEEEYRALGSQMQTLKAQMVEIYGNIRALRWALGEITDTDFSVDTAASFLEKINAQEDWADEE